MNPDELKATWQAQWTGRRVTLDADVVLRQLERAKDDFEGMIFWRDVREVGVALLLVPLWIYLGRKSALPWTWYLVIPTFLWVAGFMVVDRARQKRRQPKPGDTLRQCIESSLAQVEHQIWLLRNVFWWYLLPPGSALAIFFGHCAWQVKGLGLDTLVALLILGGAVAIAALIDWGVYRLNQWAVKKELEPRRQELKALLRSLESNGA